MAWHTDCGVPESKHRFTAIIHSRLAGSQQSVGRGDAGAELFVHASASQRRAGPPCARHSLIMSWQVCVAGSQQGLIVGIGDELGGSITRLVGNAVTDALGAKVSMGGDGAGRIVTGALGDIALMGGDGRIVKDALGVCCGFSVCVTEGHMTWSAVHCTRVGSQHGTGNTVGKGLRDDRGDGVGQVSVWKQKDCVLPAPIQALIASWHVRVEGSQHWDGVPGRDVDIGV